MNEIICLGCVAFCLIILWVNIWYMGQFRRHGDGVTQSVKLLNEKLDEWRSDEQEGESWKGRR